MSKEQRVKKLIESLLIEAYTPNEVKETLWNVFKLKAESINVVSSDEDKIVFKVIPNEDLTVEEANELLGELHDSDLFDVVYDPNQNAITITFFQHGVDNKYKEHNGIYSVSVDTSKMWGKPEDVKLWATSDRAHKLDPLEVEHEIAKFSATEDYGLIAAQDNNTIIASVPKYNTEIFYSFSPITDQFLIDYFAGTLNTKPMNSVEVRGWIGTLDENDITTAQHDNTMGVTAFGKPDDGKYNQDTIMEDNINGGASDAELALVEELATIEHEQWKGWASALMESEPNISAKRLERWKSYMGPYEGLPNDIKEKDREFARKSLEVLKAYLKRRIAEKNNPTPSA